MKQDPIKQDVKTVGKGGQIYLGKAFAGQHVLVTQKSEGVWVIKTADVIPHDEQWAHTPKSKAKLEAALTWLKTNPVKASQATSDEEMEALFEKALAQADAKAKPK